MEKQRLKHLYLYKQMLKRKFIRPPESGFTLIEVLIGLVLMAIVGLVFTSALQFTGRDYQTVRLLNRASRVATSEVETLKDMAARGDFTDIKNNAAGAHPEYNITWEVTDYTINSAGKVVKAKTGDDVYLKEVTITVAHKTHKDISVVRIIRVGPR
ncbi:MAG: prepilin-type N-terminal cleavage/methylation domain-containing protein [Firmicutes bacterium]|nr:prepilin-type N-terminal cleavage/methylation domain-containing protein [Bacillota bacterium]